MSTCTTCGNSYDKAFEIRWHDGRSFQFDSFECAIQELAPTCGHCGCRIIGHGMETEAGMYCCAHCAEQSGEKGLEDRLP
jgi:hypothetical protein